MKPVENIEQSIKNLRLETIAGTDQRILTAAVAALAQSTKTTAADKPLNPGMWGVISSSKVVRLAAAAVIIVAAGLFAYFQRSGDRSGAHHLPEVSRSPAEMLTAMSLGMAYRRGGMEAVYEQCDQAFKMFEPCSMDVSIRELLAECDFNNEQSERTKL